MKYISHTSARPPSLLRKTAVIIGAAAVAGLMLIASAVLLGVVVIIGLLASAYLWWKTRELRKQMRNFPPRGAAMGSEASKGEVFEGEVIEGEVIEGEVIRVDEPQDQIKR